MVMLKKEKKKECHFNLNTPEQKYTLFIPNWIWVILLL